MGYPHPANFCSLIKDVLSEKSPYLIPHAEWPRRRLEVIRQTGTPGEGLQRLVERETALEAGMAQVEKFLARQDSHIRMADNAIILSPLAAENRPASAEALENRMTARLPQGKLRALLMEVDAWTHCSHHFVHTASAELLRPPLLPHRYASILAHACHFGAEQMAQSTDRSYRQLAWGTTWYRRAETRAAAFTHLGNSHHKLPLSQVWGSGILSSSAGHRLPVSGKNRHARAFPPTLG
jgi:hypothetical protein